jgi:signal transduction histidine kinase
MPKFGEKYCFLIPDDPSVCPFITEKDTALLRDLKRRLRQKCLTCDYFRQDLEQLRREQNPAFDVGLMLLDETLLRGRMLTKFSESLEIRDEMLDILLHLSNTLEWTLDPHEIIYKGLVAFTAGTSFGFNRGVALLANDGRLQGTFALGPRNQDEANQIWKDLTDQGLTMVDLLLYSPEAYERERAKFQWLLDSLSFALTDPPFEQAFELATVLRVNPDMEMAPTLRDFYQQTTVWVLPLFSHVKIPLGVILVDNFLTQQDILLEDTRAMQIFAKEISLALERGLAYTELREKLQRLEEANRQIQEDQAVILKLKEDIAAGEMVLQLTHSVKNPIVAIGGLARQLNRKLGWQVAYSKYIQAIVREATRLEEMLKDFVRFVDARYASDKEWVNVNQVITVLCQEKERLWQTMKIKGHVKLNDDMPLVLADRRQLYNCLENLVNNAIEAMPAGGTLFLETDFDDDLLTIRVADTGLGMPEEALRNLFKPFFTTKATGSGLGLYTAKEILEGLGGTINIICEPGNGCTVLVKIPWKEEPGYGDCSGH